MVVREVNLEAVEAHEVIVHGCDTELVGKPIEIDEVRQRLGHSALGLVIDLQGPPIIVRVLDIGQFESLVRLQTHFHCLFKLLDERRGRSVGVDLHLKEEFVSEIQIGVEGPEQVHRVGALCRRVIHRDAEI